jgi:hypothetical protein
MRTGLAGVVLAAALSGGVCTDVLAQESGARYVPGPGDEVVVYTHRFKPESFEDGLKLVREGFPAAQKAAGQTRMNEFIVDAADHKVVVVSFFGSDSAVEDWTADSGRADILKQLELMWREPQTIEKYELDSTATVP